MRTLVLFSALAVVVLSAEPDLVSQPMAPPPVAPLTVPEADRLATPPGPTPASQPLDGPLPNAPVPAQTASGDAPSTPPNCALPAARSGAAAGDPAQTGKPCAPTPNPLKPFLDTTAPLPLTPEQKAHLAFKGLTSWGNLATITGTAAYTIGTDAHTAYGPGLKGFGRNTGYSLLQDATGTFFGTFLVPSLTHQDPRYRRMPHARVSRRFLHAISWTVIGHSDYGKTMPNYANLLSNPICAEISNLYVPGVNGNGPSTVERILAGYETAPVASLITEFLPDVASHIHVRVIFVQRILNKIATGQYIP